MHSVWGFKHSLLRTSQQQEVKLLPSLLQLATDRCVCVSVCAVGLMAQYLWMCVGGSQGSAGGGGAVRVTGAGEGTVAIAIERRLMTEGRVRKSERLRTLRVTLHTATNRKSVSSY